MAPQSPRPPSRSARLNEPHDRRGQTQSPAHKAPRRRHGGPPATPRSPAPISSFWDGPDPVPLPARFARIKRALIAGHEDAVEASWARLLATLRREAEHIDGLGAHLVPSIEFGDVVAGDGDGGSAARFRRDLQRYGVGVVRKVVPRREAEAAMRDTARYVAAAQQHGDSEKGAAETMDPACYNLFWSPAQVAMRAHPNVRAAQRFMMSLWDADDEGQTLSTQHPITYADRIRVYGTHDRSHDDMMARPHGAGTAPQTSRREDWSTALQSSAGITAQVDNGSLERWEPDGYHRAGVYARVFAGRWEQHDPWRGAARRAAATTDLYNGHGACSVLRMFQGVLALSVAEPGVIRLLPSPRAATAYYLLRPFFAPVHGLPAGLARLPAAEQAAAWERYLAPDNWRLTRDPDTVMHGAVPGHAQRVTERWHPHLRLRWSMITLPTLQPGDYILWHPDLPYHISSDDGGSLASAADDDNDTLRMLVYMPAAPLTQTSALYLARQRRAFRRGQPGPDFDARNRPTERQDAAAAEAAMARVGGLDALRTMGLAPWDEEQVTRSRRRRPSTPSEVALPGARNGEWSRNSGEDEHWKANEVVRLANSILFPDTSLLE